MKDLSRIVLLAAAFATGAAPAAITAANAQQYGEQRHRHGNSGGNNHRTQQPRQHYQPQPHYYDRSQQQAHRPAPVPFVQQQHNNRGGWNNGAHNNRGWQQPPQPRYNHGYVPRYPHDYYVRSLPRRHFPWGWVGAGVIGGITLGLIFRSYPRAYFFERNVYEPVYVQEGVPAIPFYESPNELVCRDANNILRTAAVAPDGIGGIVTQGVRGYGNYSAFITDSFGIAKDIVRTKCLASFGYDVNLSSLDIKPAATYAYASLVATSLAPRAI